MMKELTRIFTVLYAFSAVYAFKDPGDFQYKDSQKTSLCLEVSKFTPNLCRYSAALKYCNELCKSTTKQQLHCGKRTTNTAGKVIQRRTITRRIVGGTESKSGDWPWHVSLRINGKQWCSGAILSERFVLTAAHCFDMKYTSRNPKDWEVYGGDHHLSSTDIREQRIGVKKIIMHPKFDFDFYNKYGTSGVWVVGHNDIAILQLSHALKLEDPDKTRVCLPDVFKKIPDLYSCRIIGWGHTSYEGEQPDALREATVLTVPNKICNLPMAYNKTIRSNELLCAGFKDGGTDACNFDSGGSMVCEKQGTWYATGLVSSGFECARPHSYGLYTNVRTYKGWIIKTILEETV